MDRLEEVVTVIGAYFILIHQNRIEGSKDEPFAIRQTIFFNILVNDFYLLNVFKLDLVFRNDLNVRINSP